MTRKHKRRKWAKEILKKRQRHPLWPTVRLAAATLACLPPRLTDLTREQKRNLLFYLDCILQARQEQYT